MDSQAIAADIRAADPAFIPTSVEPEGEGDFCRAFTVNQSWIFRFARNAEGSRSLEREAALLPRLAPALDLPIPRIRYLGRQRANGLAFVGYRKIPGLALTPDDWLRLPEAQRAHHAATLAEFLRRLHAFSPAVAREAGVVECAYPFGRTESGIAEGSAETHYAGDLARLLGHAALDAALRAYCVGLVAQHLAPARDAPARRALIHGDLSQDHVLYDAASGELTGVIDFTDVLISDPLLDLMYLYASYGGEFLDCLLTYYAAGDGDAVRARVRLLYAWYTALRLLWALEHHWSAGVDRRLRALRALQDEADQVAG